MLVVVHHINAEYIIYFRKMHFVECILKLLFSFMYNHAREEFKSCKDIQSNYKQ